ncbi:hypothetical protein IE077_004613 [Cardiosporidium cionae]|uniref:Uncharacterized protein n=1 Tax=Cardiosporidium cionae TaxID=476202 RepID=A0ABQ7J3P2_9APIC|nr:hypothetical protein IE077_004613 [Cardiosporidium cionae]|eukprot:KAF8817712.1 hypothetical protein IE077_004613 [Cardiosporidium cionae]
MAFILRIRQAARGVKHWYGDSLVWQKSAIWASFGAICGYFWGSHKHRQRVAKGEFANHLHITEFNVKVEDIGTFEEAWNSHARVTQKQPGYQSTKLYKAIDWDDPPLSYLQVRSKLVVYSPSVLRRILSSFI